ncbi:hypothetical protein RIF29_22137 [Crotalaria pallida]|uniref:Uncharacterized protein n=1 Tax=Crotalaria pallida TaxID=3830 RepID=A0AAN9IE65_CROPI
MGVYSSTENSVPATIVYPRTLYVVVIMAFTINSKATNLCFIKAFLYIIQNFISSETNPSVLESEAKLEFAME